MPSKMNKSSL